MRPFTNRQKLLLACALAVAVVVGVAVAAWPREPRYGGKPLSYWLDQLPAQLISANGSWGVVHPGNTVRTSGGWTIAHSTFRAESAQDQDAPYHAISTVGTRGLAVLIARLGTKNSGITHAKLKIQDWALKTHLIHSVPIVKLPLVRRGQAVTAFLLLGDTAKPVLPEVLALAKSDHDPGVRASALEVLRRLSPADYAQVTGQSNAVSAAR